MTALRCLWVIAWMTLREGIRGRVLLSVLGFVVVLIGASLSAASVSLGQQTRIIVDLGLAAASGLGSVIAIGVTVVSFSREIERRTAYPLLARPLPRWAFVLGKALGAILLMWIAVSIMLAATALTLWAFASDLPAAFWPSWGLGLLEMALVVCTATMFSCLASPVMAATFSIGVILAGNFADDILTTASRLSEQNFGGETLFRVLYYLLPDVQELSLRAQAANDLSIPAGFLANATVYGLTYAATTLLVAIVIFSRRKII